VCAGGVTLGRVRAVLVDGAAGEPIALEISNAWGAGSQLLPLPAARVRDGVVYASPLAFLAAAETSFYERQGARRVSLSSP
jgi:hypothetical protein